MSLQSILTACLITACAVLVASGQGKQRTITNADLETYRAERLEAERELRENYNELGFESPEVRAERLEAEARERAELAERLSIERMEAEERAYQQQTTTVVYPDVSGWDSVPRYRPYFYSFGYRWAPYYRTYRSPRRKRGPRGWKKGFLPYPTATMYLNWRRRQFERNRDRVRRPTNRRGDRRRR